MTPHGWIVTDLHLFVLRHQAALQFLRVSKLFQQVQGQLLVQALLGQKHVLHRGREEEAKDGERERERQSVQISPVQNKERNRTRRGDSQSEVSQYKKTECCFNPAITDFLATWGQQKQKQSSDTFIIIKSFLDSVKVCEQFWPRASWRRWVSSLGSSPTWPLQSYKTWRTCRQEAAN